MDGENTVMVPNPMNKWMIWGVKNHLFLVQHPYRTKRMGKRAGNTDGRITKSHMISCKILLKCRLYGSWSGACKGVSAAVGSFVLLADIYVPGSSKSRCVQNIYKA